MKIWKHVPPQLPTINPCQIAFIEDAPSDSEVVHGKALCGPDGKLFDQALRLAGVERSETLITYAFDFQFPGDDIRKICFSEPPDGCSGHLAETWRFPGGGYLSLRSLEQFQRLQRLLEAYNPAVIVTLGVNALWLFTGFVKLLDARGTVIRSTMLLPGAKIVPTFKPSDIRKNYKMLGTFSNDIKRALEESRRSTKRIKRSKRELWLAPSLNDIEDFFNKYLLNSNLITIDIETAKGQITCVGFGADKNHAISIPFVDYRKPSRNYWGDFKDELRAWEWVQLICSLATPKLFQNGPYDCFYFIRMGVKVNNWRYDTRLLHHALYPELPKSLAYMGSVYCHENPWKLWANHAKGKVKRDA